MYRFSRTLENLPRFMYHVEAVSSTGARRSHWIVEAPGGTVEWDAEILEEQPGERLTWCSLPGSDIHHQGSVRFRDAPADRGTEVEVELQYHVELLPATNLPFLATVMWDGRQTVPG